MSKNELRSGLESWIRDTREVAENLESRPGDAAVDVEELAQVAKRGSDAELDALAGRVAGELAAVARKVEVLRSSASRLSSGRRRELERAAGALAEPAPPEEKPPPAAPPPTPPPPTMPPEPAPAETGLRRISARSFDSEVLEAEVPVLVNLVLERYGPCAEAAKVLESAREIYGGEVKLCALDVMEAGDDVLPQMLKIGKGFMVKNLPAVLVFWRGRKIGDASGDVEARALAELIRSEAT